MDDDKVVRSPDQHIEIIEAFEAHDPKWAASIARAQILGAKRFFDSKTRGTLAAQIGAKEGGAKKLRDPLRDLSTPLESAIGCLVSITLLRLPQLQLSRQSIHRE